MKARQLPTEQELFRAELTISDAMHAMRHGSSPFCVELYEELRDIFRRLKSQRRHYTRHLAKKQSMGRKETYGPTKNVF